MNVIELLKKKHTWEVTLDELDYHRTKKRYTFADPQNRGIIVESLVVVLFSRLFGKGSWLGSANVKEYWDVQINGVLFDIKSTENHFYPLGPSPKQMRQSEFFDEEIRYILASPKSWNDSKCSVTIEFHDSMLLKNGILYHLERFDRGQKKFCPKNWDNFEVRSSP